MSTLMVTEDTDVHLLKVDDEYKDSVVKAK